MVRGNRTPTPASPVRDKAANRGEVFIPPLRSGGGQGGGPAATTHHHDIKT